MRWRLLLAVLLGFGSLVGTGFGVYLFNDVLKYRLVGVLCICASFDLLLFCMAFMQDDGAYRTRKEQP